ncbi:hypothetical protein [Mucilaginibacter sp.]|uniref:hypothetical protein n=1 Tax=Mucilaginibacter sp. TaxID=1882438 RepID=UPI003266076D
MNNPINYIDRFGLDTGRVLPQVNIIAYVKKVLDVAFYTQSRSSQMPRYLFWKPKSTDPASSFDELRDNAIIKYSSKSVITGNLLEKMKKDPAFLAWRNQILAQFRANPLLKRFIGPIKFGGGPFFSTQGDTELKLAIGGSVIIATIENVNSSIIVNYQVIDKFDLDYQKGRSNTYNGINAILKPIWTGVLDGRSDMAVEARWNETIK